MPNYKVVDADVLDGIFTDIGDAIRAKTGGTEPIEPGDMAEQIEYVGRVKVKDGTSLFANNHRIDIFDMFDFSEITSVESMFEGCTELANDAIQNLVIDNSKVTNISKAFSGCQAVLETPPIYGDFPNVTSAEAIYKGANIGFETIVINAPNATTFSECFRGTSVKNVVLGSPNSTTFNALLANCYSLEEITVDISKANDIGAILFGCGKLHTANIKFGTLVTNTYNAFYNITSLKNLNASGEIGGISWNFSPAPLTAESAKSVIDCLVDYSGTDKEYTYTFTFSATTKANLEAEGATAPDGNTWLDYAFVKGWNV
jgi:hypothetical protein